MFGIQHFWSSPLWTKAWDGATGCFDLGFTKIHPEIVLASHGNLDGGSPVIMPANHLTTAALCFYKVILSGGLSASQMQPDMLPLDLNFTFTNGKVWLGRRQEATLDVIRDQLLLWVGKHGVHVHHKSRGRVSEQQRDLDAKSAEAFEEAAMETRRLWDTPLLEEHARYDQLRLLVVDIAKLVAAGQPGEAMKTFQKLAQAASLCLIPLNRATNSKMIHQLYSYACYLVAFLDSPSTFGWQEAHFNHWALKRLDYCPRYLAKEDGSDEWGPRLGLRMSELALRCNENRRHLHPCRNISLAAFRLAPVELPHNEQYDWTRAFLNQQFGSRDRYMHFVRTCDWNYCSSEDRAIIHRELSLFREAIDRRFGATPILGFQPF
ncbi:hypothetical protein H2200_003528 [Cladophialophora chaetospira]|uniref:Uncharacterized protein n=1 Tax=Cladophialophora chaetospira TaxID=386627 RepID=A0AA38XHQ8_9EURO|nr:hypothetical protein H2200_003528 [Cladophialophora chaetospira]